MWEGITTSTFNGLLDEIKEGLPIIIPVVVGFMAIRKGWAFVKEQLMSA